MMMLTLTALLSCAMTASGTSADLTELVASIPAQDEFLIYDIRGDLSSDDVLAAFSGFNVPYKFKSLCGRRFIIVVMKDSSNHTKYASLSFPGASQVDVYPAEHLSDFYEYHGASGVHDNTVIALPNDNLYLQEFSILEQGADLATFKAHVKARGEEYRNLANGKKARLFHVTAMMPVKIFGFVAVPAYILDRVNLEGSGVHVGPHQIKEVTTPFINL